MFHKIKLAPHQKKRHLDTVREGEEGEDRYPQYSCSQIPVHVFSGNEFVFRHMQHFHFDLENSRIPGIPGISELKSCSKFVVSSVVDIIILVLVDDMETMEMTSSSSSAR